MKPASLLLFLAIASFGSSVLRGAGILPEPTPRTALRALSTDRPDQTESPYTVDTGHWQLELDFVNATFDREAGTRTEAVSVLPVNLKLGLNSRTDLQLMFASFTREHIRVGGARATTRDWGDLTLRLKVNAWGNDDTASDATAFAFMPWVKIPLNIDDAGSDRAEGGIIIPFAAALPGGWSAGLMTEFDAIADASDDGTHFEWVNSLTFSRDLTARLGGYVELYAVISAEPGSPWVGQFDFGFTYALSDDIQFDAGCNLGVTRSAPDVQPFLGLSVRY